MRDRCDSHAAAAVDADAMRYRSRATHDRCGHTRVERSSESPHKAVRVFPAKQPGRVDGIALTIHQYHPQIAFSRAPLNKQIRCSPILVCQTLDASRSARSQYARERHVEHKQ